MNIESNDTRARWAFRWWRFRYWIWLCTTLLFLLTQWPLVSWLRNHSQDESLLRWLMLSAEYVLIQVQLVLLMASFFQFIGPVQSHLYLYCPKCETTYSLESSPIAKGSIPGAILPRGGDLGVTGVHLDLVDECPPDSGDIREKAMNTLVRARLSTPNCQQWRCNRCGQINSYTSTAIDLFLLTVRVGVGLCISGLIFAITIGLAESSRAPRYLPFLIFFLSLFCPVVIGFYLQGFALKHLSRMLTAYELDQIVHTNYPQSFISAAEIAELAIRRDPEGFHTKRSRKALGGNLTNTSL